MTLGLGANILNFFDLHAYDSNCGALGRLTQRLECHPHTVEVAGSNPAPPIFKSKQYNRLRRQFFVTIGDLNPVTMAVTNRGAEWGERLSPLRPISGSQARSMGWLKTYP